MLQDSFDDVYTKFKLHFYKKVFETISDRETSLSTVETFCIEIIHALKNPTVNEFASFINISAPNAAYKVNSLIQKGYLEKVRSEDDKREYHLTVTPKFFNYYNLSHNYMETVVERVEQNFPQEDVEKLAAMLAAISKGLMPELKLP